MITPHLWFARLSRPLRWRGARRTAKMLLAFAAVERSSFHDLLAAANRTADLNLRARFLQHAVDERRHAEAFAARALQLDPTLSAHPSLYAASFEHLHERLGEARFVAFVHHGERRGCAQMQMYRGELAALEGTPRADPDTLELFEQVIADEERHEAYTAELCVRLGASHAGAVWWELGRAWRRAGGNLAASVFHGLTMAIYLLIAPLAALERFRAWEP